ncbi:reverse transcriptase domain-containing protein [Tanacetum coccineum]
MPDCARLIRAQGLGGNRPNQALANDGGQGRGNHGNQARGRAFMLGAKEARRDPNIMTGTFTLNDHYATTLFDSGADYSFVSTTFVPMLGIEPSELGFNYEIEIATGPEEKVRHLMSAKAKEMKQEEIMVVRDFPEGFDESGTPRISLGTAQEKEVTPGFKNCVFNVGASSPAFPLTLLKIFSGKLKTRWSGPFTLTQVFPYVTFELSQNSGPNFKVNGHRLKHYFGGDIPQLVVPDLQTFPMDQ